MSLKIDRLQLDIVINNDQARKSLRELEDHSIQLQKQMAKVPKGSEEWNKMNTRLKELKVQHDKVIESIGIQGLSTKELAQRQKELNLIMRNMDPRIPEYQNLQQQLTQVTSRQRELRGSLLDTRQSLGTIGSGFGAMKSGIMSLLPMLGLGAGLAGAFTFVKSAILSVQSTGDKFEMFMGGISEVTNHLKQTLATLDFTKMISGFKAAFEEGKRYADVLDLIGDLERSLQIERADIDVEITQQRIIAKNRRLDLDEREAAVDKIVELEKKKMEASLEYENLRLDNELTNASKRTGAGQKEIEEFLKMNQIKATEIVNQGAKIKAELEKQATYTVTSNNRSMGRFSTTAFDQAGYDNAYKNLTDNQKEAIRLYELQNNLTEEQRAKITQVLVAQKGAVQTMLSGEESLVRLKNSLYNELIKEEKAEVKLADTSIKALDEKKKAQEDYYNEIQRLSDGTAKQQMTKDEQELFAIVEKYRKAYELAVSSGQDSSILDEQFATEMEEKRIEIEDRTWQATIALKEKYGIDVTGELIAIEMEQLYALYDQKLFSEEEFQIAKQSIIDKYNKEKPAKEAKTEKAKSDVVKKWDKLTNDEKMDRLRSTVSESKVLFGEQTAAYRILASAEAAMNTWKAADLALASFPPPYNFVAMGLTIAAGLANVAKINAVQFASGKYDVIGASDGKTYRADYAPTSKTGIYNAPTLIGDGAPELVVDGPTLRNMQMNAPGLIQAILQMRVPQYAAGNYGSDNGTKTYQKVQNVHSNDSAASLMMLTLLAEISEKLDKPTRAAIVYSDLDKSIKEVETIKKSVSK